MVDGRRGQAGTSRHWKEAAGAIQVQGHGSLAEDGSTNGEVGEDVDGKEPLRRGPWAEPIS